MYSSSHIGLPMGWTTSQTKMLVGFVFVFMFSFLVLILNISIELSETGLSEGYLLTRKLDVVGE